MTFNKLATTLALGAFAVLAPACALEPAAQSDADAEESATSQDELSSNANKLVGLYHGKGSVRPPSFETLDLRKDGSFSLDLDTGIRCVRAPCPSHAHVEGRFTATRSYLRLRPTAGEQAGGFHGYYRYTLRGDALSLSRGDWNGWTNDLDRAQDVWPSDATKLVADSPGGGFTPPPPPGSNCAIGRQKYTLDVASRKLDWEQCDWNGGTAPLRLVTGSRTLSRAEVADIEAAANSVTISTRNICGADKPMMKIHVTTPKGTETYTDDFYSCMGQGPFVENIGAVFSAMRELAK
jgi:hypothetical protein